jgi:hypothetical protein
VQVKELVDGKLQRLADVLRSLFVILKPAVGSCNTLVIFIGFPLLLFAPKKIHCFALSPSFSPITVFKTDFTTSYD